ncbi:transposase [Micromonospora sp. NPDC051227]|uniref:transposase n=1 Tax=Micromonospora sp. NPDC051227 TaxID=3364285 RepID=UPI003797BD5C
MQRLLRTVVWDGDAVRDEVRDWLIEQLGHPDAVLVTDATGFLKKGLCSVGSGGSTPAPLGVWRTAR